LVIDFAKKYGHVLLDNTDDSHVLTHDGIDRVACDCCNSDIEEDDNYFILTVDDDILIDIADHVGRDISGCANCEGDERSQFVRLYNSDTFDTSSRMEHPEGISVSEYFYDKGVPEELNDIMCKYIQCPCGHGHPRDWVPVVRNPRPRVWQSLLRIKARQLDGPLR
jgi:hypothetical protein